MCGITGALSLRGPRGLEQTVLAMREALLHRGPDDSGLWSDGICTLGHRRLAIIDLSPAGRQPISNEDGTVWIVFNGEIYNFQALRRELEAAGHTFSSHTDTEAIIHAYEEWGTDCVRRFRGMFAFAIWDQRRRRIFLARDRVGKKPLFYATAGDVFWFASELQGLLVHPDIPRDIDHGTIDEYLAYGYIAAPRTAYREIRKLPPAHWMTVDLGSDRPKITVERYWSLEYLPKLEISEAEAIERLRHLVTEAVSLRMISDVPLGAFLSGGLDSSIVVGLMAKLSTRPVRTFTIGFEERGWSEVDHARRVARKWNTDHYEFVVHPDAMSVLPTLVRHYGEPYADSSAIPTFYVAQLTRRNVTVALNGDGADESFAGYTRHWATGVAERMMHMRGADALSKAVIGLLPDSANPKSLFRRAHRFVAAARLPIEKRYPYWVGIAPDSLRQRLYTRDFLNDLSAARPDLVVELLQQFKDFQPEERVLATDVHSYLPFDLLVKVDITSMANSLEARSPFLDHEVMEFAARLPLSFKLKGRDSKYLPKKAFADLLPAENVKRAKMGFGVPVGEWFRGPLRQVLTDTILSENAIARGYFNRSVLAEMVGDHVAGRVDFGMQLWALFMLEMWHREVAAPRATARAQHAGSRA